MSVRARQLILLGALGLALIFKATQPGALFSFAGGPDPFPGEFVATAPPAPNVYADRPDVRVLQLLSSMNGMWDAAFRAADASYAPPRIETRAQTREGCGGEAEADWAGVYCARGRRIVIDLDDHLVRRAAVGDGRSDDLLGYVLAHEVGHHVQYLRGATSRIKQEDVVRAELHAECLAGVWGRAAGRQAPPGWSYAGDADHGTALQQQRWLETGYARGRPADCDAVWQSDPLP